MRAGFIPFIVIFVVLMATEALLGNKIETVATLSVRQRVDSEISNLEKNLKMARENQNAYWSYLENTLSRIKTLRAKNPRQFEPDELYMDYVYFSLREFPLKADFTPEKCGQYRSALIANFNPRFETLSDPAISKTLGLLKIFCP